MFENIANASLGTTLIVISVIVGITFVGIFFFITYQANFLSKLHNSLFIETLIPLSVEELNKELEPYGFAYNQRHDLFYSIMYPWQRKYGYGKPYDDAAPLLSMIIDCEPIYFEYDNKKWLIEFWKGQYGMTTGAEIGVYVSESKNLIKNIIYDAVSDEDCIPMSFVLRKQGNVLLTRNNRHWWLTGFKLGEFSKPSDLVMEIIITLKNKEMRDAFVNGLKKVGYKNIRAFDNSVSLTFDKPYTKQAKTRSKLITYIMQRNNKQNCYIYNSITKKYDNALDKTNYIRQFLPGMYAQLFNFSKTEQLFMSYKTNR